MIEIFIIDIFARNNFKPSFLCHKQNNKLKKEISPVEYN